MVQIMCLKVVELQAEILAQKNPCYVSFHLKHLIMEKQFFPKLNFKCTFCVNFDKTFEKIWKLAWLIKLRIYRRPQNLKISHMFSEKATKIDEIFTNNLMPCSKCQINGEDFSYSCGLLRKYELYLLASK